MAKKQTDESLPPPLSTEDITDRAYAKFGPRLREQFSRKEVREVVATLRVRLAQQVRVVVIRDAERLEESSPCGPALRRPAVARRVSLRPAH